MANRYQHIFKQDKKLFSPDCPVMLVACAALKDEKEQKYLAQLKFNNCSTGNISGLVVSIDSYDQMGNHLEIIKNFHYMDLNVSAGEDFGTKTPVYWEKDIPPNRFEVTVEQVLFENGTSWENKASQESEKPTEQNASDAKQEGVAPEAEKEQISTDNNKKKRRTKGIVAIVIIVAIICALFAFFNANKPQSGDGGTAGKLVGAVDPSSIDYVEPDTIVKSVSIGDATFHFTNDWYYEDSKDSLMVFFDKDKPTVTYDFIYANYFSDLTTAQVTDQQIEDTLKTYRDVFVEQIFPDVTVKNEELIERDGSPAYHLVVYLEGQGVQYDMYLFMANKTDVVAVYEGHIDGSKKNYSKEFLEFVRSIEVEK